MNRHASAPDKRAKHDDARKINLADADKLIQAMATLVNNTLHHYWLSNSDAHDATIECASLAIKILDEYEEIAFRIFDGALLLNGMTIEKKTAAIKILAQHLTDLEIHNFSLLKGLSDNDFIKLIEILGATPFEIKQLGGFQKLLADFDLKHIEAKTLIFREITEEETIVYKDEIQPGSTSASGDTNEKETIEGNILAFLKGDISLSEEEAAKEIQDIATDAQKMAELIIKAAEVKKASTPIENGESLVDFVVGSLKRTYRSLMNDKSAKTKTGQKRITRNLLLVEEEILNRMREMSEEWTEEDFKNVTEARTEITDELKIDSVSDDFITKQKASERTEKQMLKLVNSMGIRNLNDLQQKLLSKGLSPEGWRDLVIKSKHGETGGRGQGGDGDGGSGAGKGEGLLDGSGDQPLQDGKGAGDSLGIDIGLGGAGTGGFDFGLNKVLDALGHLDVLLTQMENEVDDKNTDAGIKNANINKVITTVQEINQQVKDDVSVTEEKIDLFVDNLLMDESTIPSADPTDPKSKTIEKSGKKGIFDSLVEIIDNIYEPLLTIQSSLHVLTSNTLGNMNQHQSNILHIAVENVERIKDSLEYLKNKHPARASSRLNTQDPTQEENSDGGPDLQNAFL